MYCIISFVVGKDISNFVDLASSTLGEDDLAAQKTRCLLIALTGYAPLIYYDFSNTTTSFEEFLEMCNGVWDSLKENKELPNNLVSRLKCEASALISRFTIFSLESQSLNKFVL